MNLIGQPAIFEKKKGFSNCFNQSLYGLFSWHWEPTGVVWLSCEFMLR